MSCLDFLEGLNSYCFMNVTLLIDWKRIGSKLNYKATWGYLGSMTLGNIH